MLTARKTQYFARIINRDFIFKEANMREIVLTVIITIQIPMPPAPTGEALERYNAKQKRSDRKIDDY